VLVILIVANAGWVEITGTFLNKAMKNNKTHHPVVPTPFHAAGPISK